MTAPDLEVRSCQECSGSFRAYIGSKDEYCGRCLLKGSRMRLAMASLAEVDGRVIKDRYGKVRTA